MANTIRKGEGPGRDVGTTAAKEYDIVKVLDRENMAGLGRAQNTSADRMRLPSCMHHTGATVASHADHGKERKKKEKETQPADKLSAGTGGRYAASLPSHAQKNQGKRKVCGFRPSVATAPNARHPERRYRVIESSCRLRDPDIQFRESKPVLSCLPDGKGNALEISHGSLVPTESPVTVFRTVQALSLSHKGNDVCCGLRRQVLNPPILYKGPPIALLQRPLDPLWTSLQRSSWAAGPKPSGTALSRFGLRLAGPSQVGSHFPNSPNPPVRVHLDLVRFALSVKSWQQRLGPRLRCAAMHFAVRHRVVSAALR
ncbi:hypothetical protein N658DRAFT_487694 [Parathielavia hyrcaniae]|uniref:Uncharacterized protein n=1 Tax=Parathielavia hyrcaniae TaxID=113614 RepID=A0AAN6Q0J8_9PEZI|nr:hypothetical protein N658DRAFT_487694 [Parathielavia hyrcaniae]